MPLRSRETRRAGRAGRPLQTIVSTCWRSMMISPRRTCRRRVGRTFFERFALATANRCKHATPFVRVFDSKLRSESGVNDQPRQPAAINAGGEFALDAVLTNSRGKK